MSTERPYRRLQVVGAVLILLGIALVAGGTMLVVAGGSVAYLLAGIGFAASGALLWRGSTSALLVYAVLLAALLAWSLSEVGLDWWPLAARLDLAFVFGVLLVLPWIARPLAGPRGHVLSLGAVVAVSAIVAVVAGLRDPHAIDGELPTASLPSATAASDVPDGEWHAYGRTAAGQRWSPLAQITPANVGELQVAWQFRSGDVRGRPGDPEETTDEVTPLKIGARLYFCTPHQSVIALDATTGAQAWRYDPKMATGLALQHQTCRGLSYQPAPDVASPAAATPASAPAIPTSGRVLDIAANDGKARADCGAKLFLATADGRLIALDPDTGAVCSRFGGGAGQVDLGAGMPNLNPGSYYSTSPVVVTKKLVIVGGTVLDNVSTKEESGVIRAYDVDTGALVWNWDSGNPDVTAPLAAGRSTRPTRPTAGPSRAWTRRWAWSTCRWATSRPTSGAAGAAPPSRSIRRRWSRWTSPPAGCAGCSRRCTTTCGTTTCRRSRRWSTWTSAGRTVPALVQPTKQGELFVLDRRTGKPVLPVTEVPAPQGAAEGDHSAPTQPKSALSYEPPKLVDKDMWGATIVDQMMCRIAFAKLRYEGRFTPPSTQGSLIYPGNFGTFNWGGVAVDPQRQQVAFTTPTYLAFVSTLVPRENATAQLVQGGHPPHGMLPALNENFGAPFAIKLGPFTSPLGIPCQAPPWGYVAGADLRTGRIAWKHRNGTVRDLSPVPLPIRMGVPNLGGPVMTGGGVAFLSGSMDDYVRGYDVHDGRQVWESRLPAGGQATPMTYTGADGRQFLLVIAGGHGSTHTKPGDYVIAYALPKK